MVHALFVIVFSPLFTRRVHTVFASTRAYECLSTKINGQFVPGALSPVIIILSTVTRESTADLPRSHYLLALVFDSPPPPPPTRTDLFQEFAYRTNANSRDIIAHSPVKRAALVPPTDLNRSNVSFYANTDSGIDRTVTTITRFDPSLFFLQQHLILPFIFLPHHVDFSLREINYEKLEPVSGTIPLPTTRVRTTRRWRASFFVIGSAHAKSCTGRERITFRGTPRVVYKRVCTPLRGKQMFAKHGASDTDDGLAPGSTIVPLSPPPTTLPALQR